MMVIILKLKNLNFNNFFFDIVKDADDYNECDSKKAFFIFGSNGNGKTSGVYAIAKQHGYKVVEVSASHVKLTSKLLQQFNESLHSHVITNSRNDCTKIGFNKSLILFDDFDAIIYDKNFQDIIRMIKILIEQSRKPIVIISRFNPEIFMFDDNGGRLSLEILELKPPPIMAVINRLIFILQFEFNNYTLANDLRYFLQNNAYELKDLRKILINTYFWFYHNRPYYKNIWNNIFSFEFSYLLKNNYQYHYHHHIALNSMDNDSNKEDNLVRLAEYLNESARINEKLSLDNIYQTSIDCKLNNEFYSDVNVPFSMLIIQDEPQKELEISLECKFCHSNLDENLDIKSTMNDAEKMLHFYILSQNIAKNDYFEYLSFFAQILCHPSSTNHSKSLRGLYKILLSTNRPRTRSRY